MKKYLLFAFIITGININAQTKINYIHPKFDSITVNHRSIAILPFDVIIKLRPLEQKELREGGLETMQKKEGFMIQIALDAFLFNQKLKKEFNVDVQSTDTTNILLREKGWNRDTLNQKPPKEIAAFLGVDAVISGTFIVNRPVSREVSKALMSVTGIILSTISGNCTVNIYNGENSELLWQYKRPFAQGPSTELDYIINGIMKGASRKLPY